MSKTVLEHFPKITFLDVLSTSINECVKVCTLDKSLFMNKELDTEFNTIDMKQYLLYFLVRETNARKN